MARFGRSKTDEAPDHTANDGAYDPFNEDGPELHDVYPDDNASAPAQSVTSLSMLDVEETDEPLPKRTRSTKENPFAAHVKRSLDTGKALKVTAPDAQAASEVEGLVRRAASNAEHGIDVRKVENDNGSVTVHFKSNPAKRARAYTVDDVRAWARENGYPESQLKPRVHKDVSTAYRAAHGHKVPKSK